MKSKLYKTKIAAAIVIGVLAIGTGTKLVSKFGMDIEDFVVSIDGNKTYAVIGVCREDGTFTIRWYKKKL